MALNVFAFLEQGSQAQIDFGNEAEIKVALAV